MDNIQQLSNGRVDNTPSQITLDSTYRAYEKSRRYHWDQVSKDTGLVWNPGKYYHQHLVETYKHLVQPGRSVLEIGCGDGNLLAAVKPNYGCGIDFCARSLLHARSKFPSLHFILADAHEIPIRGIYFDYVLLSDLLNDVWDVQAIFESLIPLVHPETRIIINIYSRLWEVPLSVVEMLKLARPVLYQNWLTLSDLRALTKYSNLEIIRAWQEILLPLNIPIVSALINHYFSKIPPLDIFCLSNFILARPLHLTHNFAYGERPSVSIVIPARNEAGNIDNVFSSLPNLGAETEVIFVEGNSKDDTYSTIDRCINKYPWINAKLLRQTGAGKGDAVRLGFDAAKGDILMILDADLTVPPNYLIRFYEAICTGKGELINGVRLVYPMERQAMRFLNLVGNKLFSLVFTWLLGQTIKDTLCGTKVLWRKDYLRIAQNRSYFGDFDPFGDFDLLFGASRLGLKIIDMPIRYRERTYGTTNISRWKHGMLLFRMLLFGAKRLKFI